MLSPSLLSESELQAVPVALSSGILTLVWTVTDSQVLWGVDQVVPNGRVGIPGSGLMKPVWCHLFFCIGFCLISLVFNLMCLDFSSSPWLYLFCHTSPWQYVLALCLIRGQKWRSMKSTKNCIPSWQKASRTSKTSWRNSLYPKLRPTLWPRSCRNIVSPTGPWSPKGWMITVFPLKYWTLSRLYLLFPLSK